MNIDPATVERVYVGKDHACRCGCKGAYHEAGTPGFIRAIKKAEKLVNVEHVKVDDDGGHVNVPYGNDRAITLYFR